MTPGPLPHLFRILWPFWFLRDHMRESQSWAAQLLADGDPPDPQACAELVGTALGAALEVGDDEAALAADARLKPLLPGIDDPFLRAIFQLAMAWCAPITGDFDGALQAATQSLEQLRALDEPFWTTLAVGSVGTVEKILDRNEDALRHMREARDLGNRFGSSTWLAAWSQVQLGTPSITGGDLRQARALLDEALDLRVAARNTAGVALCLATYARLASEEGDPGRAARLAGRPRHAAASRRAGVADAALRRGRTGSPAPPDARRGAVRPGVLRRVRAQPAGGDDRRPEPAWHPRVLSRSAPSPPA